MISLRERVYRVIEAHGEPMTTQAVARKMRIAPQLIAPHVCKLTAYGYLIREQEKVKIRGTRMWCYRFSVSGKPYEGKGRDLGYEQWRDQQYGTEVGP